jgi:hypothetical protein
VVCVVVNALLIALAILIVWLGAEWVAIHPVLERHVDVIRAVAIAGILALPAAALGRHVTRYATHGNGIHLSPTQLPICHRFLVDACDKLGVDERPDLYLLPPDEIDAMSVAHSVVGERSAIAISTDLFGDRWRENERAIAFAIAHAVGAIRLGHTKWWVEMFTSYAMHIPFLRTPVRALFTFSRDRCAAFVVPDGIRGLVIHASGPELASEMDVPSFIDQALSYGGFWALLAGANRRRPHLMLRAKLLYRDGFFDAARDQSAHAPA